MFGKRSTEFETSEFTEKHNLQQLCADIRKDQWKLSSTHLNSIDDLNAVLTQPDFYDQWARKYPLLNQKLLKISEVKRAVKATMPDREKPFDQIPSSNQQRIKNLNRLLIENTYAHVPQRISHWVVVREWAESLLIALVLALIIRTFLIQPFKIPSGSMRMTLIEGDRLFVNKLRYGAKIPFTDKRGPGLGRPQRGDIIVFVYPDEPKKDFIKRLIAFGGETVEIRDGDVFINGQKIEEPVIQNIYYYNTPSAYGREGQKITVPEGHFFVLGDNSGSSHDSRFFGFVPEANVIGKAEFIFWPPQRIRILR